MFGQSLNNQNQQQGGLNSPAVMGGYQPSVTNLPPQRVSTPDDYPPDPQPTSSPHLKKRQPKPQQQISSSETDNSDFEDLTIRLPSGKKEVRVDVPIYSITGESVEMSVIFKSPHVEVKAGQITFIAPDDMVVDLPISSFLKVTVDNTTYNATYVGGSITLGGRTIITVLTGIEIENNNMEKNGRLATSKEASAKKEDKKLVDMVKDAKVASPDKKDA